MMFFFFFLVSAFYFSATLVIGDSTLILLTQHQFPLLAELRRGDKSMDIWWTTLLRDDISNLTDSIQHGESHACLVDHFTES